MPRSFGERANFFIWRTGLTGAGAMPQGGRNAAIRRGWPPHRRAREPPPSRHAEPSRPRLLPSSVLVRRAVSIALILLVVFAAALVAGFWGAARIAPERVRRVA